MLWQRVLLENYIDWKHHCAVHSITISFCFLQANSQACQGKYVSSGGSTAGGESLFVANHAY